MMIPDRSQPLAAVARTRDRRDGSIPNRRRPDPREQAIRDGRYAVCGGDQRVKLGVGEIGQRCLDGSQLGVHWPIVRVREFTLIAIAARSPPRRLCGRLLRQEQSADAPDDGAGVISMPTGGNGACRRVAKRIAARLSCQCFVLRIAGASPASETLTMSNPCISSTKVAGTTVLQCKRRQARLDRRPNHRQALGSGALCGP